MKVYVFTAHQAIDSDVLESHIEVFFSREQAIKTLKEWRDDEISYVESRGWDICDDVSDHFEACEESNYAENHTEFLVQEIVVQGTPPVEIQAKKQRKGASLDDFVTVTCYNKTEQMERREAIKKYAEGMAYCEGCERDRYTNIFLQLMAGRTDCCDDNCF